ncbi:unnamed protein product [Calypogeia fissa]
MSPSCEEKGKAPMSARRERRLRKLQKREKKRLEEMRLKEERKEREQEEKKEEKRLEEMRLEEERKEREEEEKKEEKAERIRKEEVERLQTEALGKAKEPFKVEPSQPINLAPRWRSVPKKLTEVEEALQEQIRLLDVIILIRMYCEEKRKGVPDSITDKMRAGDTTIGELREQGTLQLFLAQELAEDKSDGDDSADGPDD